MNDTKHDWIGVIMLILAVVGLFIVADQRDAIKQEAVDRGYAEWIVTKQNYTEFKWKDKQ